MDAYLPRLQLPAPQMTTAPQLNSTLECRNWHTSVTPYTTNLNCLNCLVAADTIESHDNSEGAAGRRLANDGHMLLMPLINLACLGLSLLRLTVRLVYAHKLSKVQSFHVIELDN